MTDSKQRKSHQQRKEESEKKLFNALIHIINTDGINAATCERIGLEAGVSRGLANQRLGKRDEMFARLVDRLKAAQFEKLMSQNIDGLSGGDALRKYIDVHFEDVLNDPGYQAYFVLVAGAISVSPLLKECVEEANVFVRDILAQFIQKGIEKGEFVDSIDPETQAAAIGSYLLGVAILSKLRGTDDIEPLRAGAYALVKSIEIPQS